MVAQRRYVFVIIPPCLMMDILTRLAMQLEPLLLAEEGTQDEGSVIFDSDIDASTSDDDSDAASGSLDP